MSWILGIVGNQTPGNSITTIKSIHPQPLHIVNLPHLYVAAGGIPLTCAFEESSPETGWLVVGTGIRRHDGYCTFLSSQEWRAILAEPNPDLGTLDGHFVALRWNATTLEAFSDQFGLRTLFIVDLSGSHVFSTRLDWIARAVGGLEPDLEQVGSQWLTFNQLSHQSLVKKVKRLGPGGHASISHGTLSLTHKLFLPDVTSGGDVDMPTCLQSLMRPQLPNGYSLSLGLSGGLDSRVLLSMLSEDSANVSLHLFGETEEPDVVVAGRIASEERIHQHFYSDPLPKADDLLRIVQEYAGRMCLSAPITNALKLRYYGVMNDDKKVMVDGGMGEIGRRQFMNRLLRRGGNVLTQDDLTNVIPFIQSQRATIFNHEALHVMNRGVEHQLRDAWDQMPSLKEFGRENFVDLLIIRYRFPNYGGFDQARIDGDILNYMPFAQPSFVRAAFRTSLESKVDARLYRQLIRKRRPSLADYPLVKGMITYPFMFGTVPAWAYTKAKGLLGLEYVEKLPTQILYALREYIEDTVHSHDVCAYPAYEHAVIQRSVNGFFSGRTELAHEVIWWLTFELWRQAMSVRQTQV